ncbi:MAG: glycogen/starch/alpha-glucan phosphorylase [Burkholderiales bacterium]|nr:glycogen/starch/alpha-glucan phosphorylase [Burkholderiales bacterium]
MRASERMSEPVRTGLGVEAIRQDFLDNLRYVQGRFARVATLNDQYQALAYTVRDRLLERWLRAAESFLRNVSRTVCYLSAEFLLGPHLAANMLSLGIHDAVREAMSSLDIDLDALIEHEEEPGLGNGGLGRLAACYMESMATLKVPAIGYGIRYEFGIFDQEIRDGWQVERTDKWLRYGNPWEIARPTISFGVKFGGRTEAYNDDQGRYRVRWVPEREVRGVAYDTPIHGYRTEGANFLRLWHAQAVESFDFQAFNVGDYYGAVEAKVRSETISKVLYPNDQAAAGKALRLSQQYFFVSCSLQDMIRIHLQAPGKSVASLHEKYAAQLNDTHPALAIAEAMRLLVDEHLLPWDEAWQVTQALFGYTNHTLLPEALETWPLGLFGRLLPRHLEIVFEINHRFLNEVRRRFPGDAARVARVSLIDETGEKSVRMAHLACVGSHAINGVAALHTRLLQQSVLQPFYEIWPERFGNKTNGVTPRRFLQLANPALSTLITQTIGEGWSTQLDRLAELEAHAASDEFRTRWRAIKQANKARLAHHARAHCGIEIDPDWLFDIHVKRIHEYKRQHLNALAIVTRYLRLKADPGLDLVPRVYVFGGKAAPGYFMAKCIIKLLNSIAQTVNADVDVNARMRVVFVPNFRVQVAELIYPAADLSEQISTAGKEASGTGNMKFALNGALTIGTLDGANVEIRDRVGAENFFLFGQTETEVHALRAGGYDPRVLYESDPELKAAIDLIACGHFCGGDRDLFRPLIDSLLERDDYMLLADYRAYVDCQDRVDQVYRDTERWTRMSIRNVARSGYFSSDRAIREYCRDIWHVAPAPLDADETTAKAPIDTDAGTDPPRSGAR